MTKQTTAAKARREAALDTWRGLFKLQQGGLEGAVPESMAASEGAPPDERIRQAREAMIKLVKDRFGGDQALIDQINRLAISSEEAVAIIIKSLWLRLRLMSWVGSSSEGGSPD